MQAQRPIACISKVLPLRDKGALTHEKEMTVILDAMEKWRPFLIEGGF